MAHSRKVVIRGIVALSAILLLGTFYFLYTSGKAKADPTPVTWEIQVGAQNGNYAYQAMAFFPNEIWINAGDTVIWASNTYDVHTVTFLQPGQSRPRFNFLDSTQYTRTGSTAYDGVSYYNSGFLSSYPDISQQFPPFIIPYTTYQLTFNTTGDFTYICLVHGMMQGIIHVRPAGTPYPYTQDNYNDQSSLQKDALWEQADTLRAQAMNTSDNHNVTLAIGNNQVSIMRFFPQTIQINVGDTITFTNQDPMHLHTVSYGQFANLAQPTGNPAAFDGQTALNSGPFYAGQTYKVTFVKAGTYAFRCDVHDYMGMVATITVS